MRLVPCPCQHYSKTLGGSVWLGSVVIVAERGIADFDLCSFESHVPRVPDVVERDLSFMSIIIIIVTQFVRSGRIEILDCPWAV